MPILTPRLRIQPRHVGEGKIINAVLMENFKHLSAWMPWLQTPQSLDDSETHCRESLASFILREDMVLSIYLRDTDTFIGSTGFHSPNWDLRSFEMGYWLAKSQEGKGYISESVNALSRYAFDVLQARRLEIRCDALNTRSLSVMTRLGFEVEGTLRHQGFGADGKALRDTIITSRINAEGLPPLKVEW
jgi:RimJ/RimL family protein N-acetyltransferase